LAYNSLLGLQAHLQNQMKFTKESAQPLATTFLAISVLILAGVQSGLLPSRKHFQSVWIEGGNITVEGAIDARTDISHDLN
jgi:hypothetical protein